MAPLPNRIHWRVPPLTALTFSLWPEMAADLLTLTGEARDPLTKSQVPTHCVWQCRCARYIVEPCADRHPWEDSHVEAGQVPTALDLGRQAFDRGDFEAARSQFEAALTVEVTAEALDGLAQSLWFLCEIDAGIARREEAYAVYRDRGDIARAASIALWLAVEQATSLGNAAAASGWFRRAERLLSDAPLCPAHAELEVHRGLGCADPVEALDHFQRAVSIGRQLGRP